MKNKLNFTPTEPQLDHGKLFVFWGLDLTRILLDDDNNLEVRLRVFRWKPR